MKIPPTTLDDLTWGWGDAYLFSYARDRWIALRRDKRYFLTAETLAGLEQAIMADYRDNPVSRDYDPLRAADGLDPGDEEDDEDDGDDEAGDQFLVDGTPVILVALRQTFPLWAIGYNCDTRAWTARSEKKTITENSPTLLCVALILIERRHRQHAPGPGRD